MDKATAAKLLAENTTNEGGVKQVQIEVQDWFNKYNEYKGTNADDQHKDGYVLCWIQALCPDAYEENEVEAFNKMKGYPTDEIDSKLVTR